MVEIKIASDKAACAKAADVVTVVATGHFPEIDSAGWCSFPTRDGWRSRGRSSRACACSGSCRKRRGRTCAWTRSQQAAAAMCDPGHAGAVGDATLRWLPPGGRTEGDVIVHDRSGGLMDASAFVLPTFAGCPVEHVSLGSDGRCVAGTGGECHWPPRGGRSRLTAVRRAASWRTARWWCVTSPPVPPA